VIILNGKKITKLAILAVDAFILVKQIQRVSRDLNKISENCPLRRESR